MFPLQTKLLRACRASTLLLILTGLYIPSLAKPSVLPSNNPSQNQLHFKSVAHEQLVNIGTVTAIVQDDQGFMWFGGDRGLARFDGYRVKWYRKSENKPSEGLTNDNITALTMDGNGDLWIGTVWGLNRYHSRSDTFTHYHHQPENPSSLSNGSVTAILHSKQGNIWIGTNDGLNRYDPDSNAFERYSLNAKHDAAWRGNFVSALMQDRDGHIWVGLQQYGLIRYTPNKNGLVPSFDPSRDLRQHFSHRPGDPSSLSSNIVSSIAQAANGAIWVGTQNGGVNRLSLDGQHFTHYRHRPGDDRSIGFNDVHVHIDKQDRIWVSGQEVGLNLYQPDSDDFLSYTKAMPKIKIRAFYQDNRDGVWLGHFPAGLTVIDPYASAFEIYRHDPHDPNSLSDSAIISLAEDKHGNLWVGTENGLNYLNRKRGKITRYYHDPQNPSSLSLNVMTALAIDGEGVLWAGASDGVLNRLNSLNHSQPNSATFDHYLPQKNNPTALPGGGAIWSIYHHSRDQLWIASANEIHQYQPASNDFRQLLSIGGESQNWVGIREIFEDSGGNTWVGSDSALYRQRAEGEFELFNDIYTDVKGYQRDGVSAIAEDTDGHLWLSFSNGGIGRWQPSSPSLHNLSEKDGLTNNSVNGILQDEQGYMWFATVNGLSRLDINRGKFQTYTTQYGIAGNIHNRTAYLETAYRELAFGSTQGLTLINPKKMYQNTTPPQVAITGLQILNKPIEKIDGVTIPHTQSLTLRHDQSVFSFEFAALDYVMSEKNQYAYRLKGFDKDWNYVGTSRVANYTNLDPGSYVFEVKGANNEGVWSETSRVIHVNILSPWWATWWARLIYGAIFLALIALVFYTYLQKKRTKDEQQLNQKLLDLDKVKDTFLANTSHELRTPLNGIIGLTEALIAGIGGQQSQVSLENLQLIVGSGKRLSYLINDILDFTKLKEHSITLNRTAVDVYSMVDTIIRLSEPLLDGKPVSIHNHVDKQLSPVIADENRLQQILYNLVGNAIKFTVSGSITIGAYSKGSSLWIKVSDTGIGIVEDKIATVFEIFGQEDSSRTRYAGGTGLGLAVTKQLVELHGGNIKITSKPDEGTTVSFSLSKSTNAVKAPVKISPVAKDKAITNSPQHAPEEFAQAPRDGAHILVVDDEPVNRKVLHNLLSLKSYQVTECATGHSALAVLEDRNHSVDLVLLDVMMPGINGYDVCKKIRQTYSVSQLPILFLTAKSQVSDLKQAYDVGGNDFLNKPIVTEELFSRVEMNLKQLNIHRDIESEVQKRTEALRENNLQLKHAQSQLVQSEKMSSLGTLVAGVGHEIKNPLNFSVMEMHAIERDLNEFKAFLQDLAGDDDDDVIAVFDKHFEKLFGRMSTLHEGSTRISGIVNNLQTFSRAGNENDEMAPTHLNPGLYSTLELVKSNYKSEVEFTCDIQDDPEIPCNASELNQVFMNLIVNACQAMSGQADAKLCISMRQVNLELHIAFKDTGCGMSQETVIKIFEPFYTTKPDGEGTGLGMAISYGIIARHNGRIEVSSEIGKGTTINLCLPVGDTEHH